MAEIRTATEQDIPSILELYRQLALGGSADEMQNEGPTGNFRQAFAEISALPGCEVIVAEQESAVIGTAMLMVVPNLSHNALPWAIVENVVVDSGYRGTGVGKLLMEYIKEKAGEAGCYKVQLMSDKRRNEAHKFYAAIGYNATAEGFRLYL
jgi:predicted N-acetyltransferase YhbS